jgi:hypothetical protein
VKGEADAVRTDHHHCRQCHPTPARNFPTTITIVSVRMGRNASAESF